MFKANLGEVAEVDDLVARSIDALGGLDVLVNNAGIERHAAFWDVSEAEYDAVLNVNLKGVFFATPGLRPALSRVGPRRQGDQHQLGARGPGVSELRAVLRQQGRAAHACAHAGRGAGPARHHDQQHRAGRDSKRRSTPSSSTIR
jgi:NAD(P)-dependent dehydrogenase (short-subunit alcohol dehydrogenase family)